MINVPMKTKKKSEIAGKTRYIFHLSSHLDATDIGAIYLFIYLFPSLLLVTTNWICLEKKFKVGKDIAV